MPSVLPLFVGFQLSCALAKRTCSTLKLAAPEIPCLARQCQDPQVPHFELHPVLGEGGLQVKPVNQPSLQGICAMVPLANSIKSAWYWAPRKLQVEQCAISGLQLSACHASLQSHPMPFRALLACQGPVPFESLALLLSLHVCCKRVIELTGTA